MKRHRSISLAIGLTAAVAGVSASASLAAADGPYSIHSWGTNLCLQPANGSTDQGAAILQEPCNGSAVQQWKWRQVSVGSNVFRYVNRLSGLCLDARGRAVNGTPVQQWTCNSISNEKWQPGEPDQEDGSLSLISRVSGTNSHCLDVPGEQHIAGLAMQIYRCNGTLAQVWDIFHKR